MDEVVEGVTLRRLLESVESVAPPVEERAYVAWWGTIPRDETEKKLKDTSVGTYLMRHSPNTKSYVLSYKAEEAVQHVAYIYVRGKEIWVEREDSVVNKYQNLTQYIDAMKEFGTIEKPYVEDLDSIQGYGVSIRFQ